MLFIKLAEWFNWGRVLAALKNIHEVDAKFQWDL